MELLINLVVLSVVVCIAYRTASMPATVLASLALTAICSFGFGIQHPIVATIGIGCVLAYLRRPVLFDKDKGQKPWAE